MVEAPSLWDGQIFGEKHRDNNMVWVGGDSGTSDKRAWKERRAVGDWRMDVALRGRGYKSEGEEFFLENYQKRGKTRTKTGG